MDCASAYSVCMAKSSSIPFPVSRNVVPVTPASILPSAVYLFVSLFVYLFVCLFVCCGIIDGGGDD